MDGETTLLLDTDNVLLTILTENHNLGSAKEDTKPNINGKPDDLIGLAEGLILLSIFALWCYACGLFYKRFYKSIFKLL